MKLQTIAASVAGAIIGVLVLSYFVYGAGQDSIRSGMAVAIADEVKKARASEKLKQEKVNEIVQKQYNEMVDINSNLNIDIDRLRKRPNRSNTTDKPSTIRKGTDGTSLSFEDARFLAREAARADTIRIALKSCYKYADTIK